MVQIVEYLPGQVITLKASATITKGQLVEVTGVRTVGPASAGSKKCMGVAKEDIASGASGPIATMKMIVRAQDSGSGITAGDLVACAASGKILTYVPNSKTGYIASTSGGSPTVQVTMIGGDGASFAGDKMIMGIALDTITASGWGSYAQL